MKSTDIKATECPGYFQRYVDLVDSSKSLEEHYNTEGMLEMYFNKFPSDKLEYRYDEGKWTPKEVYQHLIDSERVFAHRAFRIGRLDPTALTGYPHDDYVVPSMANEKSLDQLMEEYKITRALSKSIFQSFNTEQLMVIGTASDSPMSPRAAAFMILGHELWHVKILEERYL